MVCHCFHLPLIRSFFGKGSKNEEKPAKKKGAAKDTVNGKETTTDSPDSKPHSPGSKPAHSSESPILKRKSKRRRVILGSDSEGEEGEGMECEQGRGDTTDKEESGRTEPKKEDITLENEEGIVSRKEALETEEKMSENGSASSLPPPMRPQLLSASEVAVKTPPKRVTGVHLLIFV